jgi:hypothetical protein
LSTVSHQSPLTPSPLSSLSPLPSPAPLSSLLTSLLKPPSATRSTRRPRTGLGWQGCKRGCLSRTSPSMLLHALGPLLYTFRARAPLLPCVGCVMTGMCVYVCVTVCVCVRACHDGQVESSGARGLCSHCPASPSSSSSVSCGRRRGLSYYGGMALIQFLAPGETTRETHTNTTPPPTGSCMNTMAVQGGIPCQCKSTDTLPPLTCTPCL